VRKDRVASLLSIMVATVKGVWTRGSD